MEPELVRLFGFLESTRAVWQGRACYTEAGCAYMGAPFQLAPVSPPIEIAPPSVNSVDNLKARILATLQEGEA